MSTTYNTDKQTGKTLPGKYDKDSWYEEDDYAEEEYEYDDDLIRMYIRYDHGEAEPYAIVVYSDDWYAGNREYYCSSIKGVYTILRVIYLDGYAVDVSWPQADPYRYIGSN